MSHNVAMLQACFEFSRYGQWLEEAVKEKIERGETGKTAK